MSTRNWDALPTEILANVFDRLLLEDLRECELVCRAWHPPAHRTLLKIFLTQTGLMMSTMEKFMKYNLSTMNHSKQIQLGRRFHKSRANPDCATQLFKNLKNLERLDIADEEMLDDIVKYGVHKIIAKSCPISKVAVICPHANPNRKYYCLLNELRKSLKYICLGSSVAGLRPLSSFPCLEEIDVKSSDAYSAVQDWLPLFSQKFTLKPLTGFIQNASEHDFMAKYMETKTQEEQNLIIDKLSKLETLHISESEIFADSIRFITHYFTGLKNLSYDTFGVFRWNDAQLELFCGDFLDYICSTESYKIKTSMMTKASFSYCLPIMLNKAFRGIPSNTQYVHSTLHVFGSNSKYEDIKYGISVESTKMNAHEIERSVKLEMPPADKTLIRSLTDALATNEIDTLKVDYEEFSNPTPNYIFMIRKILDKLHKVKRVTIEVPRFCWHKPKKFKKQYPQVTYFQLDMGHVYDDRPVYDVILHMFPKVKYLKLYYIMCKEVELLYPLEVLYLDVTTLVRFKLHRQRYTDMLLVVDVSSKDEQHFYTIRMGKLATTRISKEGAQSMEKKDSTLTFRVRIPNVQLIILYLCRSWLLEQDWMNGCPEELVEAKLSLE